jgi:hypothetical protein
MKNNRPVRTYNYKTPNEVYLQKSTVALIACTQQIKKCTKTAIIFDLKICFYSP